MSPVVESIKDHVVGSDATAGASVETEGARVGELVTGVRGVSVGNLVIGPGDGALVGTKEGVTVGGLVTGDPEGDAHGELDFVSTGV